MSGGDWKELYTAAAQGNISLVRYHVDNGVDPNYQHPEILSTPLVAAINGGHTETALYLLDNGADPKLRSFFDDQTPIEAAMDSANEPVLSKLNEMGIRAEHPWVVKVRKILDRFFKVPR